MTTAKRKQHGERTMTFHQGTVVNDSNASINRQFFTQHTAAGLVAGSLLSVTMTLNRTAAEVWPVYKDFNLWQNQYDHYYSKIVGDLVEGDTFTLSLSRTEPGFPYRVVEIIPEHLMVFENIESPVPGQGVVKPGFHVFMLTEHELRTVATILMQHASLMASSDDDFTEEEALAAWQDLGAEGVKKWRDSFIPTFRRLVGEH